jgi:hypothetical protein
MDQGSLATPSDPEVVVDEAGAGLAVLTLNRPAALNADSRPADPAHRGAAHSRRCACGGDSRQVAVSQPLDPPGAAPSFQKPDRSLVWEQVVPKESTLDITGPDTSPRRAPTAATASLRRLSRSRWTASPSSPTPIDTGNRVAAGRRLDGNSGRAGGRSRRASTSWPEWAASSRCGVRPVRQEVHQVAAPPGYREMQKIGLQYRRPMLALTSMDIDLHQKHLGRLRG